MADVKNKKKARKSLSVDQRKMKRETDRARSQTRVNIGPAFSEWRELKESEARKTKILAVALVSIFIINCV